MILLMVVCAEVATYALYYTICGMRYSKREMKSLISEQFTPQDEVDKNALEKRMFRFNAPWPEVIHPYIGYVPNPQVIPAVNDYGFPGTNTPIRKKADDSIIVGILGGSFATQLTVTSEDALQLTLGKSGRSVHLINLAHGGYKQPQQLLIVAYLLSLGAEFDLLVNIDGFNEIALPARENIPVNVFPFYPRAWALRSQNFIGMEDVNKQIGYIAYMREKRSDIAANAHAYKLYRSPILSLFWLNKDRQLKGKLFDAKQKLDRLYAEKKQTQTYVTTGPKFSLLPDQDMYGVFA